MAEEPLGGIQILKRWKPKLIDALRADPDLLLQHADSQDLLAEREYEHVKALTNPSDKARDLLDYVIQKGDAHAQRLLKLLKSEVMQKTFPTLVFLKELSLKNQQTKEQNKVKREQPEVPEEDVPSKRICKPSSTTVTEKQLMRVARGMGRSWKEVARVALEIPTARLEQFVEDNPNNLREQVFAMLRCWRTRERAEATAARLHALLSQDEEWALPPESMDFLLEDS